LHRKGIVAWGQLISSNDEEVELVAEDVGVPTVYRFYVTGSVSVGKSTAVSNFRSLRTHDEWLEERAPEMGKDPNNVGDKSFIQLIDEWVAQQWRKKNFHLHRMKRPGIDIIDRCSLDAFAFTPEDEWIDKAKLTKKIVTPRRSKVSLAEGKIVLLIGDPEIMALRSLKLQRDVLTDQLSYRQKLLRIVYNKDVDGIVELDTRGKPPQRVAKELSRIIHLDEYDICNLQLRLEKVESGKITPISNDEK